MTFRACCATGFMVAVMMTGSGVFADELPAIPATLTPPDQPTAYGDLITRADALRAAEAAVNTCAAKGLHASALVTDSQGYMRAALSDDETNFIGIISSYRKAATVLAFQTSTRALKLRLESDKQFADKYAKDLRFHFDNGGYPIYRQGKFVAIIAVGGAHVSGDEECALAAVKALPWASTEPKAVATKK